MELMSTSSTVCLRKNCCWKMLAIQCVKPSPELPAARISSMVLEENKANSTLSASSASTSSLTRSTSSSGSGTSSSSSAALSDFSSGKQSVNIYKTSPVKFAILKNWPTLNKVPVSSDGVEDAPVLPQG